MALMDWYYSGSPLSVGLTITAGGGLATRAARARRRAGQVKLRKLFERFADGGGEEGLDFPGFTRRQPRRELRWQGQAPGPERRDELLPGLDDLIEREQGTFEGGNFELRLTGPRPCQPRPLGVCRRATGPHDRPIGDFQMLEDARQAPAAPPRPV